MRLYSDGEDPEAAAGDEAYNETTDETDAEGKKDEENCDETEETDESAEKR